MLMGMSVLSRLLSYQPQGSISQPTIDRQVGADLSRTSPIYRPGKGIGGPLADQSAVRQ
jgi:hypothetical protein